jgi:hypothetical protein
MSQHIFSTTVNGEEISVLMGWDRPLQGFFLVVQRCNYEPVPGKSYNEADLYVYSNLNDRNLLKCSGLPKTIDYFVSKLDKLGISVPTEIFENIQSDSRHNVGNKLVTYKMDGYELITDIQSG